MVVLNIFYSLTICICLNHIIAEGLNLKRGTRAVFTLGPKYLSVVCGAWLQGQDLVLRQRHCTWILVWVLKEIGVFTLVPGKNRTRSPCLGTKWAHSLTMLSRPLLSLWIVLWDLLLIFQTAGTRLWKEYGFSLKKFN